MDAKIVGLAVLAIVLLVAAIVGFYQYSTAASKASSLASTVQMYKSSLQSAESNATKYEELYLNATKYEDMYMALYSNAEKNYTQYLNLYDNLASESHAIQQYAEGAALDAVFKFWDGIAIENPSDVTPLLAGNFTANIVGTPFPGTYTYSSFNSTWLQNFFGNYETVYFYTTALPTVTELNNSTFLVTAVVQYFVAPTQDPVYLQVFNASNSITVKIINGAPMIVSLSWDGNELPPSTVIAGYPSQRSLQANQAMMIYLNELNSLGAELPPNYIAASFAPTATLSVNGQLPPGLRPGNYTGVSSIENFFSGWDNYFIFVAEYAQNLLPNGTATSPMVSITLQPSGAEAFITANDTVFIGFVNKGEASFPAIYDLHVSIMTTLIYNSSAAQWQIINQSWNVTQASIGSDTLYYNLNTPEFNVIGERTITVNASMGAVVELGNIIAVIRPGTYAELPNGTLESMYNFSLIDLGMEAVYSPTPGLTPLYAFAFAINGKITPQYSLVNSMKQPSPVITLVFAPSTWTSWTWFGGSFNGSTYVGGSYKFPDQWIYGSHVMVNNKFFKPVIWIFEASQSPLGEAPQMIQLPASPVFGLTPISDYTFAVNGTTGGVLEAGNIITVIQPGTYINTTTSLLKNYNFSIVFYAPQNVTSPAPGQVSSLVFAYAINGKVSFSYTATQPFITIIETPTTGVSMWTWGEKNGIFTYLFRDPLIIGKGIVINLTFVKPVPWVLSLGYGSTSTTTSTMTTTPSPTPSTTTSAPPPYTWGG